MRVLRAIFVGVLVLAFGLVIVRMNVIQIELGQTGVLTEEWGSGLEKHDYGPGFHRDFGPLHSWALFDTTVQTLSMVARERDARTGEDPLQVKSSDGYTVTMDINLKYRIKPGECWALRQELGVGDAYKTKVRNEAIDAMRPVFGGMKTGDFYDPVKRSQKAAEAERVLANRLATLHVELVAILVRDVDFDERYKQQIEDGALAIQGVEVNKAQADAARARGDTQKILAETEAKVIVINQNLEKTRRELTSTNEVEIAQLLADANRKVTELKADADLFKAEKAATGSLLMKNAEAEAQRLRQTALQGAGARNLVALEAAKGLNLTNLTISTLDNNVLDLPAFAEKLGAAAGKQ